MKKYAYVLLPALLLFAVLVSGCVSQSSNTKEFEIVSSISLENGVLPEQFSPSEITVNKDDTVKISLSFSPPAQGFNRTGSNRTFNDTYNRTFNESTFNSTRFNDTRFNRTGGGFRIGGNGGSGITFNIDEFNVHVPIHINQPTTVEFVADKPGLLHIILALTALALTRAVWEMWVF